MRINIISLVGFLLVALVTFGALAANGGESAGDTTGQCPFGIIEGPDPIGLVDCYGNPKEKAANGEKKLLNNGPILPPGLARAAHGRPDFGSDPQSGQPFMVWADRNTHEHDVAFASWVDSGWGRVEYLTSSLVDELDPRAFAAADGSIYVTWWVDDVIPRVYFSRRDPSLDGWTDSRQVAGNGSRPTIVEVDGRVWVAFERESKSGLKQVVVASESSKDGFTERVVATSVQRQSLDAELHVDAGRVWMDWKQSAQEFGFAEWGGGNWSAVSTEPWVDHSWAGEQQTRQKIRALLLSR